MEKYSISQNILKRLVAQADEADIHGDFETSRQLTRQIDSLLVRASDDIYEYAKDEMEDDVKKCIWDAVLRIMDYYDESPDGRDMQQIVDFTTEQLIQSIENHVTKNIGAFEPTVPGENDIVDTIEKPEEDEFEIAEEKE